MSLKHDSSERGAHKKGRESHRGAKDHLLDAAAGMIDRGISSKNARKAGVALLHQDGRGKEERNHYLSHL